MHKSLMILMTGLIPVLLPAQPEDAVVFLAETGRDILEHPEYRERQAAQDTFAAVLRQFVATEEGFDNPLKEVNNMLRLELGKNARIYTWQMPDSSYQYQRYGLVVAVTRKDTVVTALREGPREQSAQFKRLQADEWYGALYYEAIPQKWKGREIFTLLGYAPGQPVNEKVVDVLEITPRGVPRFGARIFKIDKFLDQTLQRPPQRLILRYGGDYAASVRWHQKKEMIVMDHLSPPDARVKGVYRMYGPDMTYDALEWDDGWWHLREGIEFDTGQEVPIVPPDKPTDLPPSSRDNRQRGN